jgi:hypothetical protein
LLVLPVVLEIGDPRKMALMDASMSSDLAGTARRRVVGIVAMRYGMAGQVGFGMTGQVMVGFGAVG